MNILFIENSFGNSYGYYHEIINGLFQYSKDKINIRVFRNFMPETQSVVTYDIQKVIDDLSNKENFKVEKIIFGFG